MALSPALDLRPHGDPRDQGPEDPSSVETEQALLGALLYQGNALRVVSVELLPAHFFEPFHGRLWQAICETVRDGDTVDPTLLAEEFRRDAAYLELGGVRYLADLVDRAPPAVRAGDYARHVLDLHHKRELIRVSGEMAAAARGGHQSAIDVMAAVEAELGKIRAAAAEPGLLVTARDAALIALGEIAEESDRGRPRGAYTGLECFDGRMGGLVPTWLVTIGGRPGMGKTALARAALYGAAGRNPHRTFAMFSLETPNRELSERAISAATAVGKSPFEVIEQRGTQTLEYSLLSRSKIDTTFQLPWLQEAAGRLPTNLFLFDDPNLGLGDVRRAVWALKAKGDLAAIAIDYLQLMQREQTRGRNDAALIGDITQGLKRLAMEAQICIVLVSQLNRGVDSRDDKRPVLGDLRESGSIEQDSNAVMFPYREAYYHQRKEPDTGKDSAEYQTWLVRMQEIENLMEVLTSKLRQGRVGSDKQTYLAAYDAVSDWGVI